MRGGSLSLFNNGPRQENECAQCRCLGRQLKTPRRHRRCHTPCAVRALFVNTATACNSVQWLPFSTILLPGSTFCCRPLRAPLEIRAGAYSLATPLHTVQTIRNGTAYCGRNLSLGITKNNAKQRRSTNNSGRHGPHLPRAKR